MPQLVWLCVLPWLSIADLCRWRPLHRELERELASRGLTYTNRPARESAPLDRWRPGTSFTYCRGRFSDLRDTRCTARSVIPWRCPNVDCLEHRGIEMHVSPSDLRSRNHWHLYIYEPGHRCTCPCPDNADIIALR